MEPSAEALAWQRRADAWAQQSDADQGAVEPANRWSDAAATGRPAFPADGVGWRTETSEWRATGGTAWRQTTEWRSTTGTHVWRSTTEAWQPASGGDQDYPPTDRTPNEQPAISGTAYENPSPRTPLESSPTYAVDATTRSVPTPPSSNSWIREEPLDTPSWQRRDDGRHLVREDDRAAWRQAAEQPPSGGRRRAPEPGATPSGGSGWASRSDEDDWAGHTDTGSIQFYPDPATPSPPSWGARAEPYSPSQPRRNRYADEAPDGSYGVNPSSAYGGSSDPGYRGRTDSAGYSASGPAYGGQASSPYGEQPDAAYGGRRALGAGPAEPSGLASPGRRAAADDFPGFDERAGRGSRAEFDGDSARGYDGSPRGFAGSPPTTRGGRRAAEFGAQPEAEFGARSNPAGDTRPGPGESGTARITPGQRRAAPEQPPKARRYHSEASDDWREQTGSWTAEPDTSNWVRDPDTGQWSRSDADPRVLAWREEAARREAEAEQQANPGGRRALPAGPSTPAGDQPRRALGGPADIADGPARGAGGRRYAEEQGFEAPGAGPRGASPYDAPGAQRSLTSYESGTPRAPYDAAAPRAPYDSADPRAPYDAADPRAPYDAAGPRGAAPYDGAGPRGSASYDAAGPRSAVPYDATGSRGAAPYDAAGPRGASPYDTGTTSYDTGSASAPYGTANPRSATPYDAAGPRGASPYDMGATSYDTGTRGGASYDGGNSRGGSPYDTSSRGPAPYDTGVSRSGGAYGSGEPRGAGSYDSPAPRSAMPYGSDNPRGAAPYGSTDSRAAGQYDSADPRAAGQYDPRETDRYGSGEPRSAGQFGTTDARRAGQFGSTDAREAGQFGSADARGAGQYGSADARGAGQYSSADVRGSGQYGERRPYDADRTAAGLTPPNDPPPPSNRYGALRELGPGPSTGDTDRGAAPYGTDSAAPRSAIPYGTTSRSASPYGTDSAAPRSAVPDGGSPYGAGSTAPRSATPYGSEPYGVDGSAPRSAVPYDVAGSAPRSGVPYDGTYAENYGGRRRAEEEPPAVGRRRASAEPEQPTYGARSGSGPETSSRTPRPALEGRPSWNTPSSTEQRPSWAAPSDSWNNSGSASAPPWTGSAAPSWTDGGRPAWDQPSNGENRQRLDPATWRRDLDPDAGRDGTGDITRGGRRSGRDDDRGGYGIPDRGDGRGGEGRGGGGRSGPAYREGGTGDWRRELADRSELAEGESRRFGTQDYVPFRSSGSAAVPGASNLSMTSTSLIEPVARNTGVREREAAPRPRDDFFDSPAERPSGSYERRAVTGTLSPSRKSDLLEPDDEEEEQTTSGGPLAVVGYTVIWYGVPVILFLGYMVFVHSNSQTHALDTLGKAAPQFLISLVLSVLVALGLRFASASWKAVSVGLAAAVVGAGLATVLSSAITGNSLS